MDRPHLMSGGRYPVLRSLGILYVLGAALTALAAVGGIVWAFAAGPGDMADRSFIALSILAGAFFLVLSMLAIAELLKLFIDMEHNTRAAAQNVSAPASRVEMSATPAGGHVNRIRVLDEETAEAALIRGH